MPPQIPSPVVVGGGRRPRRGVGEILLTSLARNLLNTGLQLGLQQLPGVGDQTQPPSREREAQEIVSQQQLREAGGSQESTVLREASPFVGGTEEDAEQAVGRLGELRQTAPERLAVEQQRQAEEEKAAAEQVILDSLTTRRDQFIEQFGAGSPEVVDANRQITAARTKFAAIDRGLSSEERNQLQSQIAPDLETQLSDRTFRTAIAALEDPSFDIGQIVADGEEASVADLIALEELGLGQTYRSLLGNRQTASNTIRDRAASLARESAEAGIPVPVRQMEIMLRTGEAPSERAAQWLNENRARIELDRSATRFGIIDRLSSQPAAQLLLTDMREKLEAGKAPEAAESYNKMRRMLKELPGIESKMVDDFFPVARTGKKQDPISKIRQTLPGGRTGERIEFGSATQETPPSMIVANNFLEQAGDLTSARELAVENLRELNQIPPNERTAQDQQMISAAREAVQLINDALQGNLNGGSQ